MTTLIVVYVASTVIWFILASLACYRDWKRGVDQDIGMIVGLLLTSFIPVMNTYMIFNVLFDLLGGAKLKGRKQ